MQVIKLNNHTWEIDTNHILGSPGGFGEVYRGVGHYGEVAIKRLKVKASQAAHRELQIGKQLSERALKNIVPILDYGQDADSDRYFIVMPICDQSLQDQIHDRGTIPPYEAIQIIITILFGLAEVKDITHRDLKPSNILMHESNWKIADFGIAKFVEDSTSLETLRSSLTPAYAAPEQWLLQRPTVATDIYAVGCIAHTLVTGQPPFSGDVDSLREQHLRNIAAPLNELPSAARSIVSQMLRKGPEIRPNLDRCITVFERSLVRNARTTESKGDTKLAQAVSDLAIKQAQEEAEGIAREERMHQRDQLFYEAKQDLDRIKNRLFEEISSHAQDVMERHISGDRLVIGNATLVFDTSSRSSLIDGIQRGNTQYTTGNFIGWGSHRKQSSWDIVAFTKIVLIQQRAQNNRYTRSANLVFGRPSNESDYRWYEMAFWSLSSNLNTNAPFFLHYIWEIDEVLSRVMGINQNAYQPVYIDGEDEDAFIDHWKDLVAQAMVGGLQRPTTLPMTR